MDNSLHALLFSEDLIAYVLKKFKTDWVDNESGVRRFRQNIDKHRFSQDVGEAVYSLVVYYQDFIRDNYKKLMKKGITNPHDFRYECAVTMIFYFSATGYDSVGFLKMCASLVGLVQQYFEKNEKNLAGRMALASSEVLGYLINYFVFKQAIKSGDLWFVLTVTGRTLLRKIKLGVPLPDTDDQILSLYPFSRTANVRDTSNSSSEVSRACASLLEEYSRTEDQRQLS